MDSYWPEAATDGVCEWCDEPLSAADVFTHELEMAGWEQDGGLLAPEHQALTRADEPIASCRKCRDSIVENYENRIEDETEELRSSVIASRMWRILAAVLFFFLVCHAIYACVLLLRP
jgi:hypothetical protein